MVVGAHIIVNGLIMHSPGGRIINDGIAIHGGKGAHHRQRTNHAYPWGGRITNDELRPASSSNSVGVAIS